MFSQLTYSIFEQTSFAQARLNQLSFKPFGFCILPRTQFDEYAFWSTINCIMLETGYTKMSIQILSVDHFGLLFWPA